MDIIPNFYIYGVPDGFDMLDGTPTEISYFLKFYNSSKENTKFSIHRNVKGQISYSYLKYNLSSGKSRTGSFFGMSLIFNGVYLDNPLRLYALFEWIYDNYVVFNEKEQTGFITPIAGGGDIQARYDIVRFSEKNDYIKRYIESVLLANISKEFVSHAHDIDSSFKSDSSILVAQEPLKSASDEKLLADLRQHNRVAVSPDWKPDNGTGKGAGGKVTQTIVTLAPEAIMSLIDDTKRYQSYIIDSLNDIAAADGDKAYRLYNEVADRLREVKSSSSADVRVSQIIKDYTNLTEQLSNLIQKIEETESGNLGGNGGTKPIPWWKKPAILKISGAVLGITVLVIVIVLALPKNEPTPRPLPSPPIEPPYEQIPPMPTVPPNEDDNLQKQIKEYVYQNKFSDAWVLLDNISDYNMRASLRDDTKKKCIDYFMRQVSTANDAKRAKEVKTKISNCKVPLGDYQAMWEDELDNKIKDSQPSEVTQNAVTKKDYELEIYETDMDYAVEKKVGTVNPKWKVTNSQSIQLDKDKYYTCRLVKSGKPISLKERVKYNRKRKKLFVENDWLRIHLDKDDSITINNDIKLTLKVK